jgi:hypothetical protein
LFDQYDTHFFAGHLRLALDTTPLHFRLSQRMTNAGGRTTHFTHRVTRAHWYEITVSAAVLFSSFRGTEHRPMTCCGIVCRDRLDGLMRVMEHEMAHLIEMLLWGDSSCRKHRFHSLTRRFFGHTAYQHNLVTPRERAFVESGIRPGMKVRFDFEGFTRTGIVNRVTKRATVLVEDPTGLRYSNGKHYVKYYIPVGMLEAVE